MEGCRILASRVALKLSALRLRHICVLLNLGKVRALRIEAGPPSYKRQEETNVKTSALLGLLVAIVVMLGVGAIASAPPDIAGTWIGKTEVPDQGTDQVTMVLKQAGEGYAGTIEDSLGHIAAGTALRDLKLEKNVVTCSFPVTDGNTVSVKLTVDGEKMSGEWTHTQGATGTIAFEKQKAE
jgi:hypothetical protein